jgi:hypothetical protein
MSVNDAYSQLTLPEVTKRAGYDNEAAVMGAVAQELEFLDEVPWFPATHQGYNKQLQAKRLGVGDFAEVNGPIAKIASETDYIEEPVKMYAAESIVDEKILAGLMGEEAYRVRDSEDALNLGGIMQDWAAKILRGSEADLPNAFKSIYRRRAALGSYCLSAGGSGSDLTSLVTFEFGPSGFYLAYQKGGQPGIKNEDRGRFRVRTPKNDGDMYAWIRYYEIWAAIVLRNERALIRMANIESSGSSNIFNASDYVKRVKNQLPSMGRNAVAFANRTLKGQIDADAYNKTNAAYSIRDITGFGPVTAIGGVPVRCWESILDTETAVA